jgi:hypothetical protein
MCVMFRKLWGFGAPAGLCGAGRTKYYLEDKITFLVMDIGFYILINYVYSVYVCLYLCVRA